MVIFLFFEKKMQTNSKFFFIFFEYIYHKILHHNQLCLDFLSKATIGTSRIFGVTIFPEIGSGIPYLFINRGFFEDHYTNSI